MWSENSVFFFCDGDYVWFFMFCVWDEFDNLVLFFFIGGLYFVCVLLHGISRR